MAPSIESPVATDMVHQIRIIRGQRVLLDADLAALYGVATKVLNQAVRRNADRFPGDFLLGLGNQDVASLRSQFVTLKAGRGAHRKYPILAERVEHDIRGDKKIPDTQREAIILARVRSKLGHFCANAMKIRMARVIVSPSSSKSERGRRAIAG